MTLSAKDRRNLGIVAAGVILIFLRLELHNDSSAAVVTSIDSVPVAERRLERLRQMAATLPGKEAVLKQAQGELQTQEAGILKADTAAQAQAQLLDTIRQAASANGIDARGADELRVRPLANDYGEVTVGESFTCGIEQLVNLLADLANRPQILATEEINVSGGNDKDKKVQVRLSLSGVVSRKLVPEKKGVAEF
ncbi:MAG: type II secretion system protein M [Acidobacteriia bacterium]|nr:type II secretion system protein M [Terriglobia bacterium]